LLLRQDNADLRLSQTGYDIGLLPERNYRRFVQKQAAIEQELARLQSTRAGTETLVQMLRRPEIRYTDICDDSKLTKEIIEQVEIAIKYAGYIVRQQNEVARFKGLEDKEIPAGFDYSLVPSLRLEARQKFAQIRPKTVGQASRISGVSPADVSILMVWLKRSAAGSPGTSELTASAGQDVVEGGQPGL